MGNTAEAEYNYLLYLLRPPSTFEIGSSLISLKENRNSLIRLAEDQLKVNNFTFISLSSEFVQQLQENKCRKLTLYANADSVATVDLERYPEALKGNKFYPYRKVSKEFSFSKETRYVTFSVKAEGLEERYKFPGEGKEKSLRDLSVLVEHWNGDIDLVRIANGAMSVVYNRINR